MMRDNLVCGLAVAMTVAAQTASAQTAHVHGLGRLNIAIDENRVYMALEAPGADLVGFEHAPRSVAEEDALDSALAQLGEPMHLLRFDTDCHVVEKNAGIETETRAQDEHHKHDQHGSDDAHEAEETHRTFTAEYVLECGDIDALTSIEFTYFEHFENARSLDIVLIDGSGQRRVAVDRSAPVLRLAE